jgi:hypothetical protein
LFLNICGSVTTSGKPWRKWYDRLKTRVVSGRRPVISDERLGLQNGYWQ